MVVIIYEDMSYSRHLCRMKEEYTVTIKDKKYLKVPKTVLRGKVPMLLYFYNNPMPINVQYQSSTLTRSVLKYLMDGDEEKAIRELEKKNKTVIDTDVTIDAKALNTAFSSNLINKLYQEKGKVTTKAVVIILIVLGITTLVILQAFGVVDVYSMLTGVQT